MYPYHSYAGAKGRVRLLPHWQVGGRRWLGGGRSEQRQRTVADGHASEGERRAYFPTAVVLPHPLPHPAPVTPPTPPHLRRHRNETAQPRPFHLRTQPTYSQVLCVVTHNPTTCCCCCRRRHLHRQLPVRRARGHGHAVHGVTAPQVRGRVRAGAAALRHRAGHRRRRPGAAEGGSSKTWGAASSKAPHRNPKAMLVSRRRLPAKLPSPIPPNPPAPHS